jgi:hypothetical protein
MKRAAVVASLPLFASLAYADEVRTETADTLVVVTPNAPVVLTQQPPGATEAPPTMPPVAPAIAQAAQPAPQNEDWNNVNHINGQLVKIGEKHEYLIKFRKDNISANPFGPFWGYYDAAYSHAINQNVAFTGSIAGYSKSDSYDSHSMLQFTVSAPVYLRRTFDGPFMEPGLIYRSSTSGYNDGYSDSMSTQSWVGPELLFGWHWNFDSGLNIAWAIGPAKHMSDNTTDSNGYSSNSEKVDVNGYFRFGYNF